MHQAYLGLPKSISGRTRYPGQPQARRAARGNM